MQKFKDMSLDSLTIAAIGSGIAMIAGAAEKWWIGIVLVVVGVGLSLLKYQLRD